MKMKGLEITVDANTTNLSAKLKAIAKHAEALANELDTIDAAKCTECGQVMDVSELYTDGVIVDTSTYCVNCRD